MKISEQLEREEKIKKEINKFKRIYKDIKKDKFKTLETLISNAAFLKVSLEEMKSDILENGLEEWFEQGSQCFKRERPIVKTYSTFIQRYATVMKILIDAMPEGNDKKEKDELSEFLKRGKIKK